MSHVGVLSTSYTGLPKVVISDGRNGGQGIIGSKLAGESLTLQGSSHATPGNVIINPNGGNVGVGTTDIENWATYSAIEFPASSILYHPNNIIIINSNSYYDGSWRRKRAFPASNMSMNQSGNIYFQTAVSGVADSAIGWFNSFIIHNNGKLSTNNELSPDCDSGGITFKASVFLTSKSLVSHGAVAWLETDSFVKLNESYTNNGGLRTNAVVQDSVSGNQWRALFNVAAIQDVADTTTSNLGNGIWRLDVYQHNGSNVFSAVADAGNIFNIANGGNSKILVKGNGDLYVIGSSLNTKLSANGNSYILGGNLGLGTSDIENWGTTYRAIQFTYDAITYNTAASALIISQNLYFDGVWKARTTGESGLHSMSAGKHYFYTNPSATQDSAVVNQLRMVITETGKISTGGEISPDCDPGGITLRLSGSSYKAITFKHNGVAHGMTALQETDSAARIAVASTTFGGLDFWGLTESSQAYAVFFSGAAGTEDVNTTAGANAPVIFRGGKKSGTTWTNIGDTGNLYIFRNTGTNKTIVKGNGDMYILGSSITKLSGSGNSYIQGGNLGVGEPNPDARLEVSTDIDEGKQAVTIDQNDADQPFVDFQGQASANNTDSISTFTIGNSIQGFIQIEINGVKRWIPYYDNPTA